LKVATFSTSSVWPLRHHTTNTTARAVLRTIAPPVYPSPPVLFMKSDKVVPAVLVSAMTVQNRGA
jgi:hypothetical protein